MTTSRPCPPGWWGHELERSSVAGSSWARRHTGTARRTPTPEKGRSRETVDGAEDPVDPSTRPSPRPPASRNGPRRGAAVDRTVNSKLPGVAPRPGRRRSGPPPARTRARRAEQRGDVAPGRGAGGRPPAASLSCSRRRRSPLDGHPWRRRRSSRRRRERVVATRCIGDTTSRAVADRAMAPESPPRLSTVMSVIDGGGAGG